MVSTGCLLFMWHLVRQGHRVIACTAVTMHVQFHLSSDGSTDLECFINLRACGPHPIPKPHWSIDMKCVHKQDGMGFVARQAGLQVGSTLCAWYASRWVVTQHFPAKGRFCMNHLLVHHAAQRVAWLLQRPGTQLCA